MNTQEVKDFFNRLAPEWDANSIRDTEKIRTILYLAGVRKGSDVLDVACGTGVLIPDYKNIGVGSITAIDLSDEMIKIAGGKFPDVDFICGDALSYDFDRLFDCIVIYDASPHFQDLEYLIYKLSGYLRIGGKLTIAHSMGPALLDAHHSGSAKRVSHVAVSAEALNKMFRPYLKVSATISEEDIFQVTGVKTD